MKTARAAREIGWPCGCNAPVAGSTRNAVTPCRPAAPATLLLQVTYRYRPEGCGHASCTFSGSVTDACLTRLAPSISTAYAVSSGPTAAYSATLPFTVDFCVCARTTLAINTRKAQADSSRFTLPPEFSGQQSAFSNQQHVSLP